VKYETHPIFNMRMPTSCPGVDAKILNPRNTWADKAAYDAQAQKLARMFQENFKQFADSVTEEIRAAGPKV